MSKFQDLINGNVSDEPQFIIPVTSLCEMGEVCESWLYIKCRRLAEDRDIIAFAKQNGHKALRVAVGYPYCDAVSGWWVYKVWKR